MDAVRLAVTVNSRSFHGAIAVRFNTKPVRTARGRQDLPLPGLPETAGCTDAAGCHLSQA